MTGPDTPGQEGPSYAPPPLPEGWIAQWDGMSRKYYFVQLSTGASQWDTPTHPAPTGPTPQATPQGAEHPYGTPGSEQQSGTPADGDRSLGGNLGNFAMNQLLGGGKKQSHGSGNSGLAGVAGMASSFLGGGHKQSGGHSNSQAGLGGLVGGLAGSLLSGGGKKPSQQQPTSYSGSQPQGPSHGSGGFMDSVGGMFGGHSQSAQGSNYGYSQQSTQQGGYTGAAPPTSYQPAGTAHTQYNPPAQHSSTPPQPQYGQNPPHSQPQYNAHEPSYGAPAHSQHPQQPQQPQYGSTPQPPYSPPYGSQPPHHDPYGSNAPPTQQSQHYPPPPNYGQPPPGAPQYGQPPPSGNLPQPQHGHFQGLHDASHTGGLYGNPAPGSPPVPMGSHPQHGQQGAPQYGAPPQGQYGGQQSGGRW